MFSVKVDFREYDALVAKTDRVLSSEMDRATLKAARYGADYARRNHRHAKVTGLLTSSSMLRGERRSSSRNSSYASISNYALYARYVTNFTRPHIIRARNAKFLRFVGRGGRIVFTKSVKHPGNRGKFDFMHPAHRASGMYLRAQLMSAMSNRIAPIWR